MMKIAATYVATTVLLMAIDAAWLFAAALPMYKATFGADLLTFRPAPGIVFYLFYAAFILVFLRPMTDGAGWMTCLLYGALFGWFAYSVYDLTGYATLKPFTLSLALSDMVWGAVLTAVASTLGGLIGQAVADRFAGH